MSMDLRHDGLMLINVIQIGGVVFLVFSRNTMCISDFAVRHKKYTTPGHTPEGTQLQVIHTRKYTTPGHTHPK